MTTNYAVDVAATIVTPVGFVFDQDTVYPDVFVGLDDVELLVAA